MAYLGSPSPSGAVACRLVLVGPRRTSSIWATVEVGGGAALFAARFDPKPSRTCPEDLRSNLLREIGADHSLVIAQDSLSPH